MKTQEILNRIQELFFQKLQAKTGWGKNDVQILYIECQNEILKQVLDEMTNKQ